MKENNVDLFFSSIFVFFKKDLSIFNPIETTAIQISLSKIRIILLLLFQHFLSTFNYFDQTLLFLNLSFQMMRKKLTKYNKHALHKYQHKYLISIKDFLKMSLAHANLYATTDKNIVDKVMINHIITQNQELQRNYDIIKNDLTELEGEKDLLENENESMQKSRQIMIGYLKNFNEIVKIESQISRNESQIRKTMYLIYFISLLIHLVFYSMLIMIEDRRVQAIYYFIYAIANVCMAYQTYLKNIKVKTWNNELKTQLHKIEQANDFINDLIDNL